MDAEKRNSINYFFVHTFNQILSWEEQSFREMGLSEITLRELHVIEAVCNLQSQGENKMSSIAKHLAITPGSLTTAVNTLVKKGYLERQTLPNDRRVVLIVPTERAVSVNETHSRFHSEMIESVGELLTEGELEILFGLLEKLSSFFKNQCVVRSRK